jgi:hypothetical protein
MYNHTKPFVYLQGGHVHVKDLDMTTMFGKGRCVHVSGLLGLKAS